MLDMLPCPFCGKNVDLEDPDTLHPDGLYWRVVDGINTTSGIKIDKKVIILAGFLIALKPPVDAVSK